MKERLKSILCKYLLFVWLCVFKVKHCAFCIACLVKTSEVMEVYTISYAFSAHKTCAAPSLDCNMKSMITSRNIVTAKALKAHQSRQKKQY